MRNSAELEKKVEQAMERMGAAEEAARGQMSPPGALGLPPLLEEKRLKYEMADFYFTKGQAAFDRVVVAQIPEDEGETYADSSVIKIETVRARDIAEAPRGIIISAGLHALDTLRSNGIDLGHTVYLTRMSTYSIIYGWVNLKPQRVLVVHAGEICLSEDLLTSGATVEVKETGEVNGIKQREHFYVDKNGDVWNPVKPYAEDF